MRGGFERTGRMILVIGDGLCYMIIKIIGFASHDTLSQANIDRFLITFLSFFAAWLLISPWLGLFQRDVVVSHHGIWRPALVAFFYGTDGRLVSQFHARYTDAGDIHAGHGGGFCPGVDDLADRVL